MLALRKKKKKKLYPKYAMQNVRNHLYQCLNKNTSMINFHYIIITKQKTVFIFKGNSFLKLHFLYLLIHESTDEKNKTKLINSGLFLFISFF